MIDPIRWQEIALLKCMCGHRFELHENPDCDPDAPEVIYTDSCTVEDCQCKGFILPPAEKKEP
jgi:hypothetical protein